MKIAKGKNLPRVKITNQAAIKEIIYHSKNVTRLQIAKQLGLALPTITTNVSKLIETGIIREIKDENVIESSIGRRTSFLEFIPESKHFLGIEMRGALRRACIVDYRGNIIHSMMDSTKYDEYDKDIAVTCKLVNQFINSSGFDKKDIAGVGFCLPGIISSEEGSLIMHPGYGWRNKDVHGDVVRLLNYSGPVHIENNACARAYGAQLFHQGNCQDAESFVYFFVSTGIACPFMLNSPNFHGTVAGEGEVGHMVMNPDGPKCICGNHGCLEAFSSERAIIDYAADAMRSGKASVLRKICVDPEAPEVEEILAAQSAGDRDICEIVDRAILYLGIAIANVDNFMRPSKNLVECKLMALPENRKKLIEAINANLYTATVETADVIFIDHDEFSGARGAAAVAIRKDLETYVELGD